MSLFRQSRWLLLHPNRADPESLWSVYQTFTKCLRAHNSQTAAGRTPDDTRDPSRLHNRPKPARPNPTGPFGTGEKNPTPDSSQPCPARPPTRRKRQMARRGCGDICRPDNRRSVRTAGADRLGAALLCAALYTCR